MSQLLDDLKAVRELLSVPERWTKGAIGRDPSGYDIRTPASDAAVCWCIEGAVMRVSPDRWPGILERLRRVARLRERSLHEWNDDRRRTHADVLALLDKAIAVAEGRS